LGPGGRVFAASGRVRAGPGRRAVARLISVALASPGGVVDAVGDSDR